MKNQILTIKYIDNGKVLDYYNQIDMIVFAIEKEYEEKRKHGHQWQIWKTEIIGSIRDSRHSDRRSTEKIGLLDTEEMSDYQSNTWLHGHWFVTVTNLL